MLYDPSKDILSITAFRMWLEQQDPSKPYDYTDNLSCPIARYLTERLGKQARVGPCGYSFDDWSFSKPMPVGWHAIVIPCLARTYGAAAERAREVEKNSW